MTSCYRGDFMFFLSFSFSVLQACLMLSLEQNYPPAYQLALDMLKVRTVALDLL